MSEPPKTVFVTKYALTDGIQEYEVQEIINDIYVYVKRPGGPSYGTQCEPKEWHRTREEALARAEEMRKDKIASHERSIAKLKKLTFS